MEVIVTIERRKSPVESSYIETFRVDLPDSANVIMILMEIRKKPINIKGEKVSPVAFECSCLEEVCGACTMNINGRARQACSTLLRDLGGKINLAPLRKFPVIRDLIVDRRKIFDALKRVKAWIPIDGTYGMGPGPKVPEKVQRIGYKLARCMSCGICMEACPQVNDRSNFIGPAVIAQTYLFNLHPTGAMIEEDRLETLLEDGGIGECGNAQNCVKVCPKGVPLTYALGKLNRDTLIYSIKRLLDT
ncbi:MAG: succinate dehydrogenase iron-sulfur subunit [Proteobacteria bacterium]|nr:succinate dehydrogenase iron-sulfur subunit [Pseudomonadota bacterium]